MTEQDMSTGIVHEELLPGHSYARDLSVGMLAYWSGRVVVVTRIERLEDEVWTDVNQVRHVDQVYELDFMAVQHQGSRGKSSDLNNVLTTVVLCYDAQVYTALTVIGVRGKTRLGTPGPAFTAPECGGL
jgi:folate-binding Fe-S cluster repair protein YgfZ